MSDSKTQLVPFGKYKGQPVEVLAADMSYCEWLAGQDWFRTRFSAIHTLIINNFTTPTETPEHNRLQARFLDKSWLTQFMWARGGRYVIDGLKQKVKRASENRQNCRGEILAYRQKLQARDIPAQIDALIEDRRIHYVNQRTLSGGYPTPAVSQADEWLKYAIERRDEDIAARQKHHNEEDQRATQSLNTIETELAALSRYNIACIDWEDLTTKFESKGVDVIVSGTLCFQHDGAEYWIAVGSVFNGTQYHASQNSDFNLCVHCEYHVECKPALGDDYPAVLRQMRANSCDTLVYESFHASGADINQVKRIFSPIAVLSVHDIDSYGGPTLT